MLDGEVEVLSYTSEDLLHCDFSPYILRINIKIIWWIFLRLWNVSNVKGYFLKHEITIHATIKIYSMNKTFHLY